MFMHSQKRQLLYNNGVPLHMTREEDVRRATKRTYIGPFANGLMFFSPDSRGFYTVHVHFWRFVQAQSSRAESILGHHRLVIGAW